MRLADVINKKIRKWNRFAQPRMMNVTDKAGKAAALGLAGAILGVPILFANPNGTKADVHLQLQLPDGYTQMGTIGGTATDVASGQVVMVGVPDIDSGRIDFHQLDNPVVEIGDGLPSKYDLIQNYPNPFNPATVIRYDLSKTENVRIDVLNSVGQHVKTLFDGNVNAGMHDVTWNGTDDSGGGVSAGLFFARLSVGDYNEVIKMIKSDGTITSGGVSFAPKLVKADEGAVTGVEYRFNIYGANIDSTSFTQRIVNDTTIVVPVQGKINVIPWSFVFNEADSSQLDLSQKVDAVFGVNTYGTEKRIPFLTTINPMTDFSAYVTDVMNHQILPDSRVEINGVTYRCDANGHIQMQINPADSLDVPAWAEDANADTANTFAAKFRAPMREDWANPAELPVTTYDSLAYNVPENLRVNPELFRAFMQEGNFIGGLPFAHPEGLKSIDWQHAQNPVPNPNGLHGFVYWIDRDYAASLSSDYKTFSQTSDLFSAAWR
jgi:hypothetical protein